MPNITKRQNKSGTISYLIRVYVDETGTGKQIVKSKTWKPPASMRATAAEKEAFKQAAIFEEQVKSGLIAFDNATKFGEYAKNWIENAPIAPKTRHRYWELYERINAALGHIRLEKLQAHHLEKFYKNLAEKGVRKYDGYAVSHTLKAHMTKIGMKETELRNIANLGITTVQVARAGKRINLKSAKAIAKVLNVDINKLFEVHEVKTGLSEQTIHQHHRLISAILEAAKRQRLVPFNVAREHAQAPKLTRKEAAYLNDEQAQRFLTCISEEKDIRKKAAFTVLLFTGVRLGELCGFSWEDIDEKRNTISVRRASQYLPETGIQIVPTKNRSSIRTIKIPALVLQTLTEYRIWWNQQKLFFGKDWQDKDNRIFIREDGRPIAPGTFSIWLNRIIKENDFPHFTPHSLRHTFATLQITAGVDIRTLQARTGHAQASTLINIYSHAIESAQEAASEALENILLLKAK